MNELLDAPAGNLVEFMPRKAPQRVQTSPAERALVGALLQDAEAVWPLADAAGIESEAFTDSDCLRIWRAAAVLRHKGKPVDMVALADSIGGDACDAMQLFSELVDACPSTAYASRYVDQVAEGQRRRKLSDAARMAADALAKGGAVDGCVTCYLCNHW